MVNLPSPIDLVLAISVLTMLLLHITCFGIYFKKYVGFEATETTTNICIIFASGLTLVGLEMIGLGYAHMLNSQSICALTLLVLLFLTPVAGKIGNSALSNLRKAHAYVHYNRPLFALCALMFGVVVISGLRPPMACDELDYHLAAPFFWAEKQQLICSPFRLTNGPALAEFIYTFSAIFRSYIAAHWTHTLFLVVLLAGCGALAKKCGGNLLISSAAILSCPVILNQASIAYNDLAAAALLIAGYCALFCGEHRNGLPNRSSQITSLLLFCGAASIKPFTLVATLVAALYCTQSFKLKALLKLPLYLLPFLMVLGAWSLHSHYLTGKFFGYDSNSIHIARTASDPTLLNGIAAGRIPSFSDLITLPVVPIITSVWGQHEPYGGRTGLLIIPFCPIAFCNFRMLSRDNQTNLLWLLAAAMSYFFLLGPVFIKTRFHIFVWSLLFCCVSAGYSICEKNKSHRLRRIATVSYCTLVLIGMIDSSRIILTWPRPDSPTMKQAP